MLDKISQYIDLEILMMLGIIIFSVILLKIIFRYITMPKVLKTILTVVVIVGILFMVFSYINKQEEFFSTDTSYYVSGSARFVSEAMDTINMDATKSTLIKGGTGKIIVKIPKNTPIIIIDSKGKKVRGKLENIHIGDSIQVMCKESYTDSQNNQITAVRITKRIME